MSLIRRRTGIADDYRHCFPFSEATFNDMSRRITFVWHECQSSTGLLDRPEANHPIDHGSKREAHIAHLNVVLRLLRARE